MKYIDWFFYSIGVILIGGLIHELYHYSFCGGEWIVGIGFVHGEHITGGMTWCNGYGGGELIPSIIEIAFYSLFIILKRRSKV